MGAVDVIPFIPHQKLTMDDAIELSKETAKNGMGNIQASCFSL
jgi:glutamate formiminotransferase